MKWLVNFFLIVLCYDFVWNYKLSKEQIKQVLTRNYFENVIEKLPPELQAEFDLGEDFVIEAGITMEEYLTEHNYTYEPHTVTTDDGYILRLDRITGSPSASGNNTKKPAVLIMHGMTSSSVDWVLIGPGRSLPLLLADAGYDVWLGNNRGNTWSRKHITLDPDLNKTFWDYSFHELGVYDLPKFIDFVLNATGEQKLSYVGHSQGSTQFVVMASMLPEYNEKILISALLAPPVYMENVTQPFLQAFKNELHLIEGVAEYLNITELSAHYRFYNKLATKVCNQPFYMALCLIPSELETGLDFLQVDTDILPTMMLSHPSSTSLKEIWHYGQEIVSGHFRQYDYGTADNLLKYKQQEPPDYNLTEISAPVGLFYALNDQLVSKVDVQHLAAELPNVVLVHEVSDKFFTHLDFVIARELDKLVNVYVMDLLTSYT